MRHPDRRILRRALHGFGERGLGLGSEAEAAHHVRNSLPVECAEHAVILGRRLQRDGALAGLDSLLRRLAATLAIVLFDGHLGEIRAGQRDLVLRFGIIGGLRCGGRIISDDFL
jgi:hypothetical protein